MFKHDTMHNGLGSYFQDYVKLTRLKGNFGTENTCECDSIFMLSKQNNFYTIQHIIFYCAKTTNKITFVCV